MNTLTRTICAVGGLAALSLVYASPAQAQAIITNGSGIYLGVDLLGHLNVPDGTSGVTLTPTNSPGWVGVYSSAIDGDATAPGCLCEGFGIAANGEAAWADNATGDSNITSISFASTAATATTVAGMTSEAGFTVTHEFQPSLSPALMEVIVTLTNDTAGTLTDVRYNRTMDWDIPPTTFSELVTIAGWPATALLDSCNNGFQSPNPLEDCSPIFGVPEDTNFTDAGPADHGARFTFGFGDLAAGASTSFSIFYGAAPTELLALAALGVVGAEVYSFGQCNPAIDQACNASLGTPMTFIFGFAGVGGTPVPPPGVIPEPGTLALFGSGLAGAIARRYRRKQN
jgi:type IV pilus assembly protein PilY1